jgi:hypothetical protein
MANGTIAVSSVEILSQSGTGVITVNPPATNTNRTITLPDGTGTLVANGVNSSIVSGTAVTAATGSPTSIDFTSIPSWAKRITVMFSGVSTSGTSAYLIQLGDAGGVETTGYTSSASRISATVLSQNSTAGFILLGGAATAASTYSASYSISLLSTNLWCLQGTMSDTVNTTTQIAAGSKTLSDTLTQVRITTVNGTDTFDAGTINILYE